MKYQFTILTSILILGIGGYLLLKQSPQDRAENMEPETPAELPRPEVRTDIPLSPMAQVLQSKTSTPGQDLHALGDIFRYYTLEPGGQIPTGTNREITRALTQKNEAGLPYIPAEHPAINADGELVDRWDTPYYFHSQSSREMEIRSAGPDQSMYTEDDLVWPKPRQQHQRQAQTSAIDLGL